MKKPIIELLFEKAEYYANINSSVEAWAESMGVHLYSNQVEIINAICDPFGKNLTILAARSSGKTYSVALAAVKLCVDTPDFFCIVFAPKTAQATRVLDQISLICNKCKDTLYKEIDWLHSNKAMLQFNNGSRIYGLGCGPDTNLEGYHCFLSSTNVLMSDGTYKKIIDINVGDFVKSYNEVTGIIEDKQVLNTGEFAPEDIYEVTVVANGEEKTVQCTGDHKWPTKNRGIVRTIDLTSEDELIYYE